MGGLSLAVVNDSPALSDLRHEGVGVGVAWVVEPAHRLILVASMPVKLVRPLLLRGKDQLMRVVEKKRSLIHSSADRTACRASRP